MHRRGPLVLALSFLLWSCAPRTVSPSSPPTTQMVDVYASAAAQPWLPDLYGCATEQAVIVRMVGAPADAQIRLRVGQPQDLTALAYQIDTEDIQIVTNRESPVQNLSADQARALFSGVGAEGLEVWVFAPAEDMQQIFDEQVMQGAQITSLALLAASPQQMSDALNKDKNAVGILPRHWRAGTVRDLYTLANIPVLAIVDEEPKGAVEGVLTCLQK